MNGYAVLAHVKEDLAGVGTTTALDAVLQRAIEQVSREFDRSTVRQFYSSVETIYLSGNGERRLYVGRDLLGVTSLKVAGTLNQPTSFEYTLSSGADYTLWPRNAASRGEPYRAIELNPNGQFAAFPEGVDNVQLAGVFGYSQEVEATGQTVQNNPLSSGGTTLTLTSTAGISPGDMLVIGEEQIYVSAVATATSLTIERGVNGTSAAQHAQGAAIWRRRYPRDVERAVAERVVGLRWDSQGGYDAGVTLVGNLQGAVGTTQVRGQYARWIQAVNAYRDPCAGYV